MTTWQKVKHLKDERWLDLNSWEREFIGDLHENLSGVPLDLCQEDIEEYLTRRQVNKVNEICNNLGL